jgi:hypothetical protein
MDLVALCATGEPPRPRHRVGPGCGDCAHVRTPACRGDTSHQAIPAVGWAKRPGPRGCFGLSPVTGHHLEMAKAVGRTSTRYCTAVFLF